MPGVVAPSVDSPGYESVSFGGGANNTQGYTVNGVRSSNNTVSLDGSALIDIGSNSGVIVTLNNDMHFALGRAYRAANRAADADREQAEFTRLDRIVRQQRTGANSVGGVTPPK